MISILNNISLKPYNTFGINVNAAQFVEVKSEKDLREILEYIQQNKLLYTVLGGGSNLLFTKDFEGIVLHIDIKGKEVRQANGNQVIINFSAGEEWHAFVMWSLEQGFSGLENLALIPGNVGSSPIQNIGAYGVEVKDVIESVEVMNCETLEIETILNKNCEFGYRDSLFKKNKGKYIVLSVSFKLNKNTKQVNTTYGAIQTLLEKKGIENPTPSDVAEAVISIRQSKLPDPKVLGNSGSFFKNPVVPMDLFTKILADYPNIPSYPAQDNQVKLAAGWLIEQAGFKGKRYGEVGVHEHQALVLVNYGKAKGSEVLTLAQKIQKVVKEKFGVALEMEVNVV
jgi:UDP-N-acetylmuramate dehydrogenase